MFHFCSTGIHSTLRSVTWHPGRRRIFLAACFLTLAGCNRSVPHATRATADKPLGEPVAIQVPLGLPPVPIPAENPPTQATVALGRDLFYSKLLSADNSTSCGSCHDPDRGFASGRRYSSGVSGSLGTRNAPTVLNAAFAPLQFWDGRASSLEDQAGGPIQNPVEMNMKPDACVAKLNADPEYRAKFEKAFGPGPVTFAKITEAIASYERTLVSGNSPFDRFEFIGQKNALSPAAQRGLAIFRDKTRGNCIACHTIDRGYALFTDGKFHNVGVGVNDDGELTDLGRYEQTKVEADKGAFKTPTLRNVARTAPYMHDGSLKTLKAVVDYYAGGANSNPYLDKEIKAIHLSGQDRADLVEFLNSLTGDLPSDAGPAAGSAQ